VHAPHAAPGRRARLRRRARAVPARGPRRSHQRARSREAPDRAAVRRLSVDDGARRLASGRDPRGAGRQLRRSRPPEGRRRAAPPRAPGARQRTSVNLSGGRFTQLPSLPLQVPGAENFGLALYGLQRSWQAAAGATTTRFWGLETSLTAFLQRYVLTDVRDPTL